MIIHITPFIIPDYNIRKALIHTYNFLVLTIIIQRTTVASQVVASFTAHPQGQAQATPQGSHDNLNLARITCLQLYLRCVELTTVQFYPIHAITAYENKIIMQTPTCTLYILHCAHAVVRYSQVWSVAAARGGESPRVRNYFRRFSWNSQEI